MKKAPFSFLASSENFVHRNNSKLKTMVECLAMVSHSGLSCVAVRSANTMPDLFSSKRCSTTWVSLNTDRLCIDHASSQVVCQEVGGQKDVLDVDETAR